MDPRVKATVRTIAASAAHKLAPTNRVVNDLPDWAGFGNQLFFFLRASSQRDRGVDYRVVRSDRSTYWINHFPLLADLTIGREDVRLADRRDSISWRLMSSIGVPGASSSQDMIRFIEGYLMPSGLFGREEKLERGLTLNVRRGDYFSDPKVRGLLSFDQIAYTQVVLDTLRAQGREPTEIRVVSDDLAWCRTRLKHFETDSTRLRFVDSNGPIEDLRTVACSRELIIMNSTFSIWAAHISNHVYRDNYGLIHAPVFGTRPFDGTPWPSLDPRWDVVADIPGGWDS